METLKLVLKKKWFDMIASGEKTEEYREIKPYWQKRLFCGFCHPYHCPVLSCEDCYQQYTDSLEDFRKHYEVTFYLGYKKDRPQMTFEIEFLSVDEGKEEWGAEKGKNYFVIKLGKRIDNL